MWQDLSTHKFCHYVEATKMHYISRRTCQTGTGAIGFTIFIIKCQSVIIFVITFVFQIIAFVSCSAFLLGHGLITSSNS